MNFSLRPWEKEDADLAVREEPTRHLILWNDDVNTFDWVISSLIEICDHTPEQAEQCALYIHYKGKYAVKAGDYDTLEPMCEAMLERSITASIA